MLINTGNISRKVLSKVLRSFDKNFERLQRYRLIFDIDINILYQKLGYALGTNVTNKEMAQKVIKDERYTRFNKLIDDKFDKNTIVRLLDDFESRNDDEIRSIVTDNADIPTIFEYVLGI